MLIVVNTNLEDYFIYKDIYSTYFTQTTNLEKRTEEKTQSYSQGITQEDKNRRSPERREEKY